jgi:hypothetical protein
MDSLDAGKDSIKSFKKSVSLEVSGCAKILGIGLDSLPRCLEVKAHVQPPV